MGIHAISTDSLRRMNDSEGLILLYRGAGPFRCALQKIWTFHH